ncbi:MAG: type VII secretion ATPase EccA [Rhodococcus sp. (in: high G+C Gram-positive bacteria)]|jgi:type VII secretion ATPase EccA
MDEKQILENYYLGMVDVLVNKRPKAGLQRFEYTLAKISPPQVDLYRAIAVAKGADNNYAVTDEDLLVFLEHIDTWGVLSVEQKMKPSYPELLQYRELMWGMEVKVTTPADVYAYSGWAIAKKGDYDRAKSILDSVPHLTRTEGADLVEALMFYRTARWNDAINAAERFRQAPYLDVDDNPVTDDRGAHQHNVLFVLASYLIAGTGWAHLGDTEAAKALLNQGLAHPHAANFPQISAEMWRVLGLLERAAGREADAQTCFSKGLAMASSRELIDTAANPNLTMTITSEAMIARRGSYWDRSTEPSLETERQATASSERAAILAAADAELDRQIGMADVKDQVKGLRASVAFSAELARRGKSVQGRSNHLVFSGPPGTGKTTIARIIARIYLGLGITRTDSVRETRRSDFIGEYQGHTSAKTKQVIEEAAGGVLFIDEAYGLIKSTHGSGSSGDMFGQEVVDELLVALENNRSDLIVIIAGYEKELKEFLDQNQGLQSRFPTWIRFDSYTPTELGQIARVQAELRESTLTPDAEDLIVKVITDKLAGVAAHNGRSLIDVAANGRFARNIIETAERFRELRLMNFDLASLTDDQLVEITVDDIAQALQRSIAELSV